MIDFSSKSWKTSTFGLIGAIGGAVMAGMVSGLIDPNDLPKWVKGVAAVMAVGGGAGVGFLARDNNKTSTDVGAVTKPKTEPTAF